MPILGRTLGRGPATTNTKSQIQKHTHRPECSLKYLQGPDKIVAWELGNLNRRRLSSSQSSFVPLLQKAFARFVRTHNCTFGTYTQLCLIMRLRKNAARGSNASDISDWWSGNWFKDNIKTARVSRMRLKTRKKHQFTEICCLCFV